VANAGRRGEVLAQIKHEQDNIIGADRELYQHGITSSVEGLKRISTPAKPKSSWPKSTGK
jgi:hypothetical protein